MTEVRNVHTFGALTDTERCMIVCLRDMSESSRKHLSALGCLWADRERGRTSAPGRAHAGADPVGSQAVAFMTNAERELLQSYRGMDDAYRDQLGRFARDVSLKFPRPKPVAPASNVVYLSANRNRP